MEDAATGRGRASTLRLRFADHGPWSEREINAPLFEAALAYSRARGPARLLLATMAALANEDRVVEDLTTEQLCSAAGLADRTYRRARHALLMSGELVLLSGVGGRGNTNRWEIPDPRLLAGEASRPVGRRVTPPAGARPLVAPVPARVSPANQESRPSSDLAPVHAARKGGHDQTLFAAAAAGNRRQKGRRKPRQKPRHPTRARERNPRTREPKNTPPTPLKGGARTTRSRSRRPTQPAAAENATGGSTSTSTRSAARSAYRDRLTTPTGRGFGSCWPKPSARAPSRSGSSPSS